MRVWTLIGVLRHFTRARLFGPGFKRNAFRGMLRRHDPSPGFAKMLRRLRPVGPASAEAAVTIASVIGRSPSTSFSALLRSRRPLWGILSIVNKFQAKFWNLAKHVST
jgi:hypothetical protein